MPLCDMCQRRLPAEHFDRRKDGQVKIWCKDCCKEASHVAKKAAAKRKAEKEKQ